MQQQIRQASSKSPEQGPFWSVTLPTAYGIRSFVNLHNIPPSDTTWASWIQPKSSRPVIITPSFRTGVFSSAKPQMWRRVVGWLFPDISNTRGHKRTTTLRNIENYSNSGRAPYFTRPDLSGTTTRKFQTSQYLVFLLCTLSPTQSTIYGAAGRTCDSALSLHSIPRWAFGKRGLPQKPVNRIFSVRFTIRLSDVLSHSVLILSINCYCTRLSLTECRGVFSHRRDSPSAGA